LHYTWITTTDHRTYKRRYRILDDLEERPLSVGELAELHQLSPNTVRRHLQELRREGSIIRYNSSDRKYYSVRHILREEERRNRRMIPKISPPEARIEETGHPVVIENCEPQIGSTRWYVGRNTVWVAKTLKTTSFEGEECYEIRRDVFTSTMNHRCYSLFYEQVTTGGRYLLGDVQTNVSHPTRPVYCIHKPRELIHPLPLRDKQSWEESHIEIQPHFSLREEGRNKIITSSRTRGTYKITVGDNTHYCLRFLKARDTSLSEIFVNENGIEVLLRNYISRNSPGWRKEMKTQPVIKLNDSTYHRRGEGITLVQPSVNPIY
jgi:DNA-binding transcriptional ArsR family regulator